jgi:hypothetical protein
VPCAESTTLDGGRLVGWPAVGGLICGTTFSDRIRSCISRSSLQLSQFGSVQYGEPCGLIGGTGLELSWLAILFSLCVQEIAGSIVVSGVVSGGFYSISIARPGNHNSYGIQSIKNA